MVIGLVALLGKRDEAIRYVLGELIAQLDRPDIANSVVMTLHSEVARQIECRATAASIPLANFVAGAVREFLESATMICGFN